MAKFAAKYIIEVYNTIVDNEISSKQLLNFLEDCLFGCFIIAEIDNKLPSDKWVKISDYQKYSGDIETIDLKMTLLHSLYFQASEDSEVSAWWNVLHWLYCHITYKHEPLSSNKKVSIPANAIFDRWGIAGRKTKAALQGQALKIEAQ